MLTLVTCSRLEIMDVHSTLALHHRYLPPSAAFSDLGFAAFDHLLAPNRAAQTKRTSGEEKVPQAAARRLLTNNPIQVVWSWYICRNI
jgi:hypothetical protein